MSSISVAPKKNLMLFSGRAHPELAEHVAKQLNVTVTPQSAYSFANGEIFVRFEESVRGCDAFVLQAHSAPINDQIMEQLIMVDALKRASAKRITVVMPFWGYSRQDKKHRGREPISARLVADMFKAAGAKRIMTVDLHTSQIQGFFDGPVDHLFALPVLAEHVKRTYPDEPLTVVSPDSGRVRLAERWADTLGGTSLAFVHKTRDPRRPNEAKANRVVGEVEGRLCVVIDDMIDTGGTVSKTVRDPAARRRRGRRRRGHPRHPVRHCVAEARLLRGARGDLHRHAADPGREALPADDRAADRAAAGRGHPSGVRGRLGDEPVRRERVTAPQRSRAAVGTWIGCPRQRRRTAAP